MKTASPSSKREANGKTSPSPTSNCETAKRFRWAKIVKSISSEIVPHVPDAWIDHDKTKIGYEIPFNRHFYVFQPPRELDEIDAELKGVTDRILSMIGELSQ